MKTILVPTDFSDIASNAIDYAVEIAKLNKAKLILFHAYSVPVVPAEIPLTLPVDEMERDVMEGLERIKKNIHLKHGNNLEVECKCAFGFPAEEINLFAGEQMIDLIVMGMEGTGYLTEKIIGNITSSLIQKAKCPVLAIDKRVKFKSIKRIALACDYEKIQGKSVFKPLKELAGLFRSHVYVLNIVPELEAVPTVSKAVVGVKLHHLLEDVDHSFHYSNNDDVVEGINQFVDDNKIDMVVMIPRSHSIFKNMFREPHTKRMIFHTKTPVLALHGS